MKIVKLIVSVLLVMVLVVSLFAWGYSQHGEPMIQSHVDEPLIPVVSNEQESQESIENAAPGKSAEQIDPDTIPTKTEKPLESSISTEPESKPVESPEATVETEPVHTHRYETSKVKATCCQEGYTLYECACGYSFKDNYEEKLSHDYTSKKVDPTTDSKGYTLYTCSMCGIQFKDNYVDPIEKETEPPAKSEKTPEKEEAPEPEEDDHDDEPPEEDEEDHGDEDYGFCPYCGRRIWTSWYPSGCFTFLSDSECECGEFVEAGECHHH